MRIFLTGATGYIGGAILDALVRAGHDVTALVRDAGKGRRLARRGVRTVVGDLANAGSYAAEAAGHDAYVHAAIDGVAARVPRTDRLTIETLAGLARESAAAGRPAVLVYTSGVWVLGSTHGPAAEDHPLQPAEYSAWRAPNEAEVLSAANDGLRTVVVRPGIVYGGSRGIVSDLFRDAANGLVRIVGTGDNHWPLVYDRDLADLYVRLVSVPDASGIFHANDEGDERVNDLVEAIGAQLPVRPSVRRVPLEEARAKQGAYAAALALDQVVRSPRARAIGWTPSLRSVAGNVPRLFEEWRAGQSVERG